MPPKRNFQPQSLTMRKFDPSTIDHCRIIVMIGKRGTGKSTLVTDILSHHQSIPHGIVMSATEESNGERVVFLMAWPVSVPRVLVPHY